MSETYAICEYCGKQFVVTRHRKKRCNKYCKQPTEIRFWRFVDKRGSDECWPWTGHLNKGGYGKFDHKPENGIWKTVLAHRFAWDLAHPNDPLPETIGRCGSKTTCVLHSCDNPPCCNPAHHFLGTQVENMKDCSIKQRKGSKLTIEIVRAIRKEIVAEGGVGHTPRGVIIRIIEKYKQLHRVKSGVLKNAIYGKTWRHVR